jgi:hypothetical protein
LLDQKVKQKIKSHRPDASGRSGEISLGHHAESFASLVTTSAFRMLLPNRNFTFPRFRGATSFPHLPQHQKDELVTNCDRLKSLKHSLHMHIRSLK